MITSKFRCNSILFNFDTTFTRLSQQRPSMAGMARYNKREQLVLFDADGTTIDAFHAIELAFLQHGMDIGDIDRFQKRRKLFKFIGGLREFPTNLHRQFGKQSRKRLRETLTEVYRHEATLYPGIAPLLRTLMECPNTRVGLVTRNITIEPEQTLKCLFRRHGIDTDQFDYFACISLKEKKCSYLKQARQYMDINPACSYACGDEYSDYLAAINSGMHPFVVSYGFESLARLTQKFGVPNELISTTPAAFESRLLHALNLTEEVQHRPNDFRQTGSLQLISQHQTIPHHELVNKLG
jgi:phosphoglycolate phosphatase